DHRRQAALGMAERGEQAPDALQRQVDDLGMELRQARQDGVGGRRHAAPSRGGWGTGSAGTKAVRLSSRPAAARRQTAQWRTAQWRTAQWRTAQWRTAGWRPLPRSAPAG